MTTVKRGLTFTHLTWIDPDWHPGPGQHLADGPKAEMVVTRATKTTVYYTYAGGTKGAWKMARAEFTKRYVVSSQVKDPPEDAQVQATGDASPKGTPPDPAVSLPQDHPTPEWMTEIDAMSHEEMARRWRFAPAGDRFLQGPSGAYFLARFTALGGMTTELSKRIGWDR